MNLSNPFARPPVVAAVVLFLVLTALGAAVVGVRLAIASNTFTEQQVRLAQNARSRLFRAQLDEETGVRGYAVTHDRVFLQPYEAALAHFRRGEAVLRRALHDLNLSDLPVGTEVRLNAEWRATIATPVLANRSTLALQLRGKQIVDRIRAADAQLYNALNARAADSDATSLRLANAIAFVALPPALIVALFIGWYALRLRSYELERRVHEGLQEAMAPGALPAVPGIQLSAVYVPAGLQSRVGGDWYDAMLLPDKRMLFSIGDVAGHGVPASVAMHRLRQTIVSYGMEQVDPSLILQRANAIVSIQNGPIVTCACGYLDPATRRILYSTAGHPPLIAAGEGGDAHLLPYSGLPLGADAGAAYTTHDEELPVGSLLVMYTDGLVEGSRDYAAGEAKVLEVVRAVIAQRSPDRAAAIMRGVFQGQEPNDDVAILTISFEAVEVTDRQGGQVFESATSSRVTRY